VECLSYKAYDKGTTDTSYKLLRQFLDLMNEKGIQMVIIGGWATEAYREGIGSKDIDIVMQNDSDVDKLLSGNFFDKEGNPIEQIYPIKRKKTISIDGETRKIICDIFCAQYPRSDFEGLGIKFHWGLMEKFKEEHEIRGMKVLVPKRELLIVSKIIALVDRSERLDKKGNMDDDEDLQSKIWKDYRDIAFLVAGQEIDRDFFRKHIADANLTKRIEKFLSGYKQPENKAVLDSLGITPKDIESALEI